MFSAAEEFAHARLLAPHPLRLPALQVRLFALYSRALTAGATVTAEEAARRAAAALVRWAGRGGLGEQEGGQEEDEREWGGGTWFCLGGYGDGRWRCGRMASPSCPASPHHHRHCHRTVLAADGGRRGGGGSSQVAATATSWRQSEAEMVRGAGVGSGGGGPGWVVNTSAD